MTNWYCVFSSNFSSFFYFSSTFFDCFVSSRLSFSSWDLFDAVCSIWFFILSLLNPSLSPWNLIASFLFVLFCPFFFSSCFSLASVIFFFLPFFFVTFPSFCILSFFFLFSLLFYPFFLFLFLLFFFSFLSIGDPFSPLKVLSQESQITPAYIFEIDPSNFETLFKYWHRELPSQQSFYCKFFLFFSFYSFFFRFFFLFDMFFGLICSFSVFLCFLRCSPLFFLLFFFFSFPFLTLNSWLEKKQKNGSRNSIPFIWNGNKFSRSWWNLKRKKEKNKKNCKESWGISFSYFPIFLSFEKKKDFKICINRECVF